MKYFIANWKANKNLSESEEWVHTFLQQTADDKIIKTRLENLQAIIIIAPPFPLIIPLQEQTLAYPYVKLACQNISAFESGSYTGEVTAKTLANLVSYAIIGHSERRKYFQEQSDDLFHKAEHANRYNIESVFCIRDTNDEYPETVSVIAYEPVYAIGTGSNESVEKVLAMKRSLNLKPQTAFLYGGSVNEDNAHEYMDSKEIDGFLIGKASLDPVHFFSIVKKSLQ